MGTFSPQKAQTYQVSCIGCDSHAFEGHLTLSHILVSRASKSHALMKYSLKVGVAARTAQVQFKTVTDFLRPISNVHEL